MSALSKEPNWVCVSSSPDNGNGPSFRNNSVWNSERWTQSPGTRWFREKLNQIHVFEIVFFSRFVLFKFPSISWPPNRILSTLRSEYISLEIHKPWNVALDKMFLPFLHEIMKHETLMWGFWNAANAAVTLTICCCNTCYFPRRGVADTRAWGSVSRMLLAKYFCVRRINWFPSWK
jgi:hypothetical protein